MPELANFPMISQRNDGDPNADFDCVPACLAAGLTWLLHRTLTASEIKDAVYGRSYIGGTAASAYVQYCEQRGVRLAAIDGSGTQLVNAAVVSLLANKPVLFTEPDPYSSNPAFSHVVIAYRWDLNTITVMDPFIAAPITKSKSEWAAQLEFNQIWIMEGIMGVPTGWHDDTNNKVLTAPNGISVQRGFRDFILNNAWESDNWPLELERAANPVEDSNTALGNGTRQTFRLTILEWTQQRGVFIGWIGQELLKVREELAAARSAPPAPDTNAKALADQAIALLQKI